MVDYKKQELKLRLSTLDCSTSTKYYQLTQSVNEKQKHEIKEFFKYYTPENFANLDNVVGNTTGWMCQSKDVEKVEEILGITETIEKRKANIERIQRKTINNVNNVFNPRELALSK